MTLFFKKKKVAHPTYTVTQKIYIILYVQNMPFIEERWKFSTSHKQNVLKNFAQSTNTIVSQKKKKKKTQFCSKKLHNNVCLKYAVFQRMLNISHVQHTQFCAINKRYNSKKLHNNVCLKYTIFWRMLNLSHVQHTQFFKNKIACSTNTMTQTNYIILLVQITQFFK